MECSVWKILCRGLTGTLYKCKVLLFLSMVLSTSKTPVADLLTIAEPEGRRAHVPLFFFFRFYYLFLERGEGKEKERERNMCKRNIDRFPLAHPSMCPGQESTWRPFAVQDDAQPAEPHQSGPVECLLWTSHFRTCGTTIVTTIIIIIITIIPILQRLGD